MKLLPRLFSIAFILASLSACGQDAPSASTPLPDPDHSDFRSEEVMVNTGAVTLTGTLLMPLNERPSPAIIIVPGSGAATRNGSWNMYRSIGEYLAGRGVAVLLHDKRGVGGSAGDWESETFDERAQDVAAMVTYLQSRSEIDPDQIGLVGHSQGAYIAPLVIAKYSEDVKFLVMLAGSGQKVWDQILTNEYAEALGNGLPETEANNKVAGLENQLKIIQKLQSPCRAIKGHYLCFVIDYDPAPVFEALTVPTLALYAELDTQVPPGVNIPMIESALKAAGNTNYTILTFEKTNHWFAQAEIGTTVEMREAMQNKGGNSYDFVPGFLDTIGDWINIQVSIPIE
jgi:uncharacterized protein